MHFLFQTAQKLNSWVAIPPLKSIPHRTTERKIAFLTGATGFIGGYLLGELLNQDAFEKYYCLVRGSSDQERKRKLKKAMQAKGYSLKGLESKIAIVNGDFTQPRLGLSEPEYKQIAQESDCVFHFAGTMNWVAPFNSEAVANIEALQKIIELSTSYKTKYLHYASSMGAWSLLKQPGNTILEEEIHQLPEGLPGGYCQLKWINERICLLARRAEVPIQIYRIGDVKGHSETGHSDLNNFGNLLMLSLMDRCLSFHSNVLFNFLPVDYVTKAIAHISIHEEIKEGKTYQFSNPEKVTMLDFSTLLNGLGCPVRSLPLHEWVESLDPRKTLDRALKAVFKSLYLETGFPAPVYTEAPASSRQKSKEALALDQPKIWETPGSQQSKALEASGSQQPMTCEAPCSQQPMTCEAPGSQAPKYQPTSIFEIGINLYRQQHDTSNTDQALRGTEIRCPRMLSDQVLKKYLRSLSNFRLVNV